ncbi:MAG: hypothetical protein ABFD97_17005 [Syntrophobacter sp.]
MDVSQFRHLASVDVGSHTTRMVVARMRDRELSPVRIERRVTRLAQGFQGTREILPEAMDRTIDALREYRDIMNGYRVQCIACGATGVARRAGNSAGFLKKAADETGMTLAVLSEDREAFLSAKGVLSVLPRRGSDFLCFDIGGGSTEFLLARSEMREPAWSGSMPVGAATITQSFLAADPPLHERVRQASAFAETNVLRLKEKMLSSLPGQYTPSHAPLELAGTAGTVTTLAAMHLKMAEYVPYRVNGLVLEKEWIDQMVAAMTTMANARRRSIPGLEPGREDIILGGAIIVCQILACFSRERFTAADAGLLEGMVIELAEKQSGLSGGLTTSLTWRTQTG